MFFFFKQKTAYEMRMSDWSSDVCSSDLLRYVDDAGYAVMKSGALSRRGYGARRVAETLRADGIAEADREEAQAQTERESWSSADRFARRKRIGPYALERPDPRSEEHTSELQSLMRISYAVFCLKKKNQIHIKTQ